MFKENEMLNVLPKLHKFAVKLTRNTHDAEDLLQSTTLRMLEKSDMFEEGTNLVGWGSKIMYNSFVTSYRRRTRFETQYDPENYINMMSVEPAQDRNMELSEVMEAMESLTSEHREILTMVCVHGLKYSEVADELDIPVGTVRSRLSRARDSLQNALECPSVPAWARQGALSGPSGYVAAA